MIRFFHHGVQGKPGGTTVGYEKLEGNRYLVTFARCSEKDLFSKEKSRLICAGRMKKGVKVFEEVKPADVDKYEWLKELVHLNDLRVAEAYGTRKEQG